MELSLRIILNEKLFLKNPEESVLGRKIVTEGLKLINNLALLFEIPACLAILDIFLLLEENIFDPAPKSVTSIFELFKMSSFL